MNSFRKFLETESQYGFTIGDKVIANGEVMYVVGFKSNQFNLPGSFMAGMPTVVQVSPVQNGEPTGTFYPNELKKIDEHTTLASFLEVNSNSRYSVEVNFRTNKKECLEAFAKIVFGYVSAALKQNGYHTKHVYEEPPMRILVSGRNWDDGEWVGIASFNPQLECFVISRGFYNKDRRSISLQSSKNCGTSAAEVTAELRNMMNQLKNEPDRHQEKLKSVPLKRGPK